MSIKNIGLRNIEVADTKICFIDGENGVLTYRGYDIFDLAKNSTFEEVSYLLLYGDLPSPEELEEFDSKLRKERSIPRSIINAMKERPKTAAPMDVLLSSEVMLADYDDTSKDSKEDNLERSIKLIAKFPTIIASWHAIRNNKDIIEPDPNLDHASNLLYMIHGKKPSKEFARYMDVTLILHAEHSFNASTFGAREVASTRAHMYACIAAGIAALSGELHGGANMRVMKALLEIGSVDKVEEWVKKKVEKGERIMGMGHAVYKTDDPRAKILREMSKRMAEKLKAPWYEMTRRLEEVKKREVRAKKGIEIYANVDLYSASVFYMMGIPIDLYTPLFAAARISGWCAHIIEEKFAEAQPKPVLYRPSASYVGKYCGPHGCEYIPLEKRRMLKEAKK
ncbi:MAG: citrate (Si)-synthase [Candidatus Nitrosothermus koennekii]|nr:MAG: citrate (Si)-synthase [Candidatus Nitrosothermus koennekii]